MGVEDPPKVPSAPSFDPPEPWGPGWETPSPDLPQNLGDQQPPSPA